MALLVLALIVIGVPIIEITLFIKVGGALGAAPTIALTFLTALLGLHLVRKQGLSTLEKARASVDAGVLPVKELFDGACILIGGLFLLVPGFFTDFFGALLLLPPVREALRQWLDRHQGLVIHTPPGHTSPGAPGVDPQARVIEAEFVEVIDPASPHQPPQPPKGRD